MKKNKIKIWLISDTHGLHAQLEIPQVDCVIHAGDSTNYYDLIPNEKEFKSFYEWWEALPIKHKIYVPGNHDAFANKDYNIVKMSRISKFLINSFTKIDEYVIYGSPYTPTYGTWHFMKNRATISRQWEHLENIDILITHGPPKGILDLAYHGNDLQHAGDGALYKSILNLKPKLHVFGHIHDNDDNVNHGLFKTDSTDFVNASVVRDFDMNYGKVKYPKGIIYEL